METAKIYSSTSDGTASLGGAVYSTVRNAATGDNADTNNLTIQNEVIGGNFYVGRSAMFFTIPTLPTGATVTSITLNLTPSSKDSSFDDSLQIVSSTVSDPIVMGDYDLFGSTPWESSSPLFSSFSVDTEKQIALNATGIAAVLAAQGSVLIVGIRTKRDIDSTSPGTGTVRSYVVFYVAETAGTTKDPSLTINYALPGGSTAYFM